MKGGRCARIWDCRGCRAAMPHGRRLRRCVVHDKRRQMSLGLSIANLGYHYAAWRHPDVPADGNMDFRHFVHCAKLAERGKFDLIFLADSSAVRDLDNPAIARDMEHQLVKHEPVALLAALSTVTSRAGLVPTASTT